MMKPEVILWAVIGVGILILVAIGAYLAGAG
jgi:hypothetical protein